MSYKVVVDEMDKEEVIRLNVPVTIPENLKYNKKGTLASKVTYNFNGTEQSNSSTIILETTSKIEKAAVIEKLDYQLINRKPVMATEKELNDNNRAHSAKLRGIERMR